MQIRRGTLINIADYEGNSGWREWLLFTKWSNETLEDSLTQTKATRDHEGCLDLCNTQGQPLSALFR